MTKQDTTAFRRIVEQLAATLRLDPPSVEGLTGLFAALEDVPLPLLEAAAQRLAQTAEFFPRPVEWRRAVDALQHERHEAGRLKPDLRGVPEEWCDRCEDTGWQYRQCPGAGEVAAIEHKPEWWPCERVKPHTPHTYAVECPCRATNPRYQEAHPLPLRQYAAEPERRTRRRSTGGWSQVADAADRGALPD